MYTNDLLVKQNFNIALKNTIKLKNSCALSSRPVLHELGSVRMNRFSYLHNSNGWTIIGDAIIVALAQSYVTKNDVMR